MSHATPEQPVPTTTVTLSGRRNQPTAPAGKTWARPSTDRRQCRLSPVRTLEGHDQLPQVQRGESSEVPLVRLLRDTADTGSGAITRPFGSTDRHDHLLRPERLDIAR